MKKSSCTSCSSWLKPQLLPRLDTGTGKFSASERFFPPSSSFPNQFYPFNPKRSDSIEQARIRCPKINVEPFCQGEIMRIIRRRHIEVLRQFCSSAVQIGIPNQVNPQAEHCFHCAFVQYCQTVW